MKKYFTKKAVSPEWQAKLDGIITVEEYNRIISKKTTLEKVIEEHNKPKEELPDYQKAFLDGKLSDAEYENIVFGSVTYQKTKKIKSYINCYAKKIGLELDGHELDSADNATTLYNDFMSYYHNNKGKLAGLCARTANYITDYIEQCYC